METEVESDKPPNSTPDEAPAPDIQLISTENSETPLRENSHPAEDTPVREPLTEDESSIVTIDSDDNDYANPEPPRELVEQQLLGADTIGNTVFSKHWLFTTLMKLLEVGQDSGCFLQQYISFINIFKKTTCTGFNKIFVGRLSIGCQADKINFQQNW